MDLNQEYRYSSLSFRVMFIAATLLCLSASSAANAFASPITPLIFKGDNNYPPYEYLNEQGEPDGFNVALARAVARQMGLDITIRLGPWHTVRKQLEAGKIDVLMGMYQSEERDRMVDFSIPHIVVSYAVFVRDNSGITSIGDARGRTLLVQKGDMGHDYLKDHRVTDKILVKEDIGDALRSLSEGEGDCALVPRLQGLMILKTRNISNVKAVGSPIVQRNYCLAVTEGNSKLLATLNEGLSIIKTSGEYDKLYDRWFGVYEVRKLSPAIIGKYIFMVAGPLLVLILLSLIWNRSLKMKVDQRTQELYKEKELLSVTLRSIGDGVITSDVNGRVVLMNRIAEKLTGWTLDEAAGLPLIEIFKIIDEKSRKPRENPVDKVLATGNIITLANHTALVRKDGREISIADSGAPIMNKESRMIGVVLVFRDVTDENRIEEELLKIKKLESVGVLAGGIAHDFNNILAAVLGSASLLRTIAGRTDQIPALASMMEKACLRAKDLTQQLLTFSKGGEPVTRSALIDQVVRDSADFVLHGSKVRCDLNFPDDLWPVEIDSGQISQVIQNLILNAVDAMHDGGIIQINGTNHENIPLGALPLKGDRYVKITLEDSGTGIPSGIIDQVFDPFFSTKTKGSGLGLAITHSIINKHNGHISVETETGRGTIFTIYLPVSETAPKAVEPKTTPAIPQKKGTILVMDDEELVRNMAVFMLEQLGFCGITAGSGEEALTVYETSRSPIDLVIMDLTIPGGMGGSETASRILERDPHARLIVSSGYSNDPIMANHKAYGFKAAIVKPYLYEEFCKVIFKVLSQ